MADGDGREVQFKVSNPNYVSFFFFQDSAFRILKNITFLLSFLAMFGTSYIFIRSTFQGTVPLKGKLTVPRASRLVPRNLKTSSFESRVSSQKFRGSSIES